MDDDISGDESEDYTGDESEEGEDWDELEKRLLGLIGVQTLEIRLYNTYWVSPAKP